MERLQRTCPECFERVVVSDTVVIPPAKADTMIFLPDMAAEDGVILNLDQTMLTLAIEGDTLLVHAERPPDTVIVTVPAKVPVPKKTKDVPVGVFFFLAFLVALFLINIKLTKKHFTK